MYSKSEFAKPLVNMNTAKVIQSDIY